MGSDVFRSVELKGKVVSGTDKLMKMGLSIIQLGANARSRKRNRLEVLDPIVSSDESQEFPVLSWARQVEADVLQVELVDKRKIGAGLLFLAWAEMGEPDHTALQVFILNDERRPYRGLKRIHRSVSPDDVAPGIIASWESSMALEPLSINPNPAQLVDFNKAITTIYYPAAS